MRPKIGHNKTPKSRSKSAKNSDENPEDEQSFETIDSANSTTARTKPDSKPIKKTSK